MPLIKITLEQKLKTKIKALEPKLFKALSSKTTGLYKAQLLVDQRVSARPPASGFELLIFKNKLWNANSKEWSKVIAKEVINLLADDISDIIATEITSYIKQATIIIPPGQVVATAGSPAAQTGATTAPSPPAKIV